MIRGIAAGLLCLALFACAVPEQPLAVPTATVPPTTDCQPTVTLGLTPFSTPTAQQRATAEPQDIGTPNKKAAASRSDFEGCWSLETEDVSFEVRLEQEGLDMEGTFLLVKMCVVADELTACRIREGSVLGSATAKQTADLRLVIPEYDDEGTFQLKLTEGGAKVAWEEIDYPVLGLADGPSRYLPPAFVMVSCGG